MVQTGETNVPLKLEWQREDERLRSGRVVTSFTSSWVTVSGLVNIVRLRPGGRIRALVCGSDESGYRADLVAEVEYNRVDPFQTVAVDLASPEEAQQKATRAIESHGVVPVDAGSTSQDTARARGGPMASEPLICAQCSEPAPFAPITLTMFDFTQHFHTACWGEFLQSQALAGTELSRVLADDG